MGFRLLLAIILALIFVRTSTSFEVIRAPQISPQLVSFTSIGIAMRTGASNTAGPTTFTGMSWVHPARLPGRARFVLVVGPYKAPNLRL